MISTPSQYFHLDEGEIDLLQYTNAVPGVILNSKTQYLNPKTPLLLSSYEVALTAIVFPFDLYGPYCLFAGAEP